MIKGTKIEFEEFRPENKGFDSAHCTKPEYHDLIENEIEKLLHENVLEKASYTEGEFISNIFTREKKDSKIRLILSLKRLNENCSYKKFKMTGFKTATDLISKECWMGSVDLVSAYYSIPIAKVDRKYLRFIWKNQRYEFTCYPNGLSQCPRNFTKLTKPIFSYLHSLGHVVTGYLDDTLIIGDTKAECLRAINDSIHIFQNLGFTIHKEKSVLEPTQQITFLGFTIDSLDMKTRLSQDKRNHIRRLCSTTLKNKPIPIRDVAGLIGSLVSSFPAVEYGPLYYRHLENDKTLALAFNRGQWDRHMTLTTSALSEMRWWRDNIAVTEKCITRDNPALVITTDSSGYGYGIVCNNEKTQGLWTQKEKETFHINELELMASFFGLKIYANNMRNAHIELKLDNMSAVNCINKMGSSKLNKLNTLTKQVWEWCITRQIHITAFFIPGKLNVEADEASRKINIDTEWQLNPELLHDALKLLDVTPTIDLFASRINKQTTRYASFMSEPEAIAVNAFSINWKGETPLIFPPFNLLVKVIKKIKADKASAIVVAPYWPTQPFYPLLAKMLIKQPILLSSRQNLLTLPICPGAKHPLHKKLKMMVCVVSGETTESGASQKQLLTSCSLHGEITQKSLIDHTLKSGKFMLTKEGLIPFIRM